MTGTVNQDITVDIVEHVATVEIHRPPNNFFDFDLIGSIAVSYTHLTLPTNREV